MMKLMKECKIIDDVPQDMDAFLQMQIQKLKSLSEMSDNFKTYLQELPDMPLDVKNQVIQMKNGYKYQDMKDLLQKQDVQEAQVEKLITLAQEWPNTIEIGYLEE